GGCSRHLRTLRRRWRHAWPAPSLFSPGSASCRQGGCLLFSGRKAGLALYTRRRGNLPNMTAPNRLLFAPFVVAALVATANSQSQWNAAAIEIGRASCRERV